MGGRREGEGKRSSLRERVTTIEMSGPNQKFVSVKGVECTDNTFFAADKGFPARWPGEKVVAGSGRGYGSSETGL